jgi:hypothetical protein
MVTPVETSDKQHSLAGRCDALARAKGLTPKHFSINCLPIAHQALKNNTSSTGTEPVMPVVGRLLQVSSKAMATSIS